MTVLQRVIDAVNKQTGEFDTSAIYLSLVTYNVHYNTVSAYLSRMCEDGDIKRIQRGIYKRAMPGVVAKTVEIQLEVGKKYLDFKGVERTCIAKHNFSALCNKFVCMNEGGQVTLHADNGECSPNSIYNLVSEYKEPKTKTMYAVMIQDIGTGNVSTYLMASVENAMRHDNPAYLTKVVSIKKVTLVEGEFDE